MQKTIEEKKRREMRHYGRNSLLSFQSTIYILGSVLKSVISATASFCNFTNRNKQYRRRTKTKEISWNLLFLMLEALNSEFFSWAERSPANTKTRLLGMSSKDDDGTQVKADLGCHLPTAEFFDFSESQAFSLSFSWSFTMRGCSAGLECRKEAFMLIICFESNVRHVANNVPKGTPSCKYRVGLSCLIQQLKALDEVIHPPDYGIYYLWKEQEQKGDRGRITRESNFIEPKCPRTWHSFCG